MDVSGWAYEIWPLRSFVPALASSIVLPDKMRRLFEHPTFRPHISFGASSLSKITDS